VPGLRPLTWYRPITPGEFAGQRRRYFAPLSARSAACLRAIGGLTGVAGQDAGLLNTSQPLGRAMGVAIVSMVAAARLSTLLGQASPPTSR
jgi:hypothetical protein